jgi:hypothetical protein
MFTNPKDKFNRIIKIVDSELRTQYINHCTLDSAPILEMVKEELIELEMDLNDDWSLSSIIRRFNHWLSIRKSECVVRVSEQSNTRQALSLVQQALREEENRYDSKTFSYWLSPLWQKLNVTRGLLVKELSHVKSVQRTGPEQDRV